MQSGLLVICLLMAGCASHSGEKLPTFKDIQSRVPMKYPHSKVKFPKSVGMITIQQLEVNKNQNLKKVWKQVDEKYIPETTQKFWLTNGMRVGVISRKKIKKLQDALPKVYASGSLRMTGSNHPQILLKSRNLHKPIALYIPAKKHAYDTGKTIHIEDGKAQLLAKLTRDSSGQFFLDLTPHHYLNKIDLIPKAPLKKQLDGKIYKNLTLRISINPGQIVVLGLYKEEKQDEKVKQLKKQDKQNNTSKPGNEDQVEKEKDLPNVKPIKHNLGSKLLLDNRFGGNLQKLILLSVQPLH